MAKKTTKKRTTKKKSEGLGDTIEKITEATGIKSAVKWLAGDDCGCEERKNKLNNLFRYKKPLCLQEDEYKWLNEWYAIDRHVMKPSEQRKMLEIYNRVFTAKQQATNCASCLREINTNMHKVYKTYEDGEKR
jgi:hypothetical protein|tara:strand:- start:531 stop:929 length:399 start_codon:yes stop_codon:yes gene_type:complete